MKTEVIIDGKVKKMSSAIARILVRKGRAIPVEQSKEIPGTEEQTSELAGEGVQEEPVQESERPGLVLRKPNTATKKHRTRKAKK